MSNYLSVASKRLLFAAGFTASTLGIAALPAFAHAATYAYVNQSQEVSTVTADTWMAAIMTAPDIDPHSGVLLLSN